MWLNGKIHTSLHGADTQGQQKPRLRQFDLSTFPAMAPLEEIGSLQSCLRQEKDPERMIESTRKKTPINYDLYISLADSENNRSMSTDHRKRMDIKRGTWTSASLKASGRMFHSYRVDVQIPERESIAQVFNTTVTGAFPCTRRPQHSYLLREQLNELPPSLLSNL